MLQYKNNQSYIEGVAISDIIKTNETPIYIYSQSMISKNYKELKSILDMKFPKNNLHKTTPIILSSLTESNFIFS